MAQEVKKRVPGTQLKPRITVEDKIYQVDIHMTSLDQPHGKEFFRAPTPGLKKYTRCGLVPRGQVCPMQQWHGQFAKSRPPSCIVKMTFLTCALSRGDKLTTLRWRIQAHFSFKYLQYPVEINRSWPNLYNCL